jgi:hypothetical protein
MKELARESIGGKKDLFTKVEELLKAVNDDEHGEMTRDLWFPAFEKQSTEHLNWLSGYTVAEGRYVT